MSRPTLAMICQREKDVRKQNYPKFQTQEKATVSKRDDVVSLFIKLKQAMKNETLSLDGEKLIPAVGAECCFIHETFFSPQKKGKRNRKCILSIQKDPFEIIIK